MESVLYYFLKEKVKQDRREKTSLADAQTWIEEVPLLPVENYCAACLSVEFFSILK
ncbi:hypothetical protein DPMN_152277 [Dreissena polymorpha]|uniref:Uncharacterized protein n=1 Tax=Dreissena polymorpha TaxID=45954 RepID=A0A9D4FLI7_DREPO|nr:hypothetical protein DPMN_152277 [Dreissena polymorpha]